MGRTADYPDWISIILVAIIACFGLFILLTIRPSIFLQQFIFLVIGVFISVCVSRMDAILLRWASPFLYIVSLLFLALSYLGPSVRGATRWIVISGIQIQPSELAKPLLLLAFAWFITRYSPRNIKYVFLHFILFFVPFILVFKQPDFGSSIIYVCFWFAMMIAGGLPVRVIAWASVIFVLLAPIGWKTLAPYQQSRILTFVNPYIDPKGAGYNALQATIAVGSGQWFGRGLGRGTQSHLRFLPEFHTDFIFATLIEELGFVGGFVLISCYFLLLLRMILYLRLYRSRTAFPFVFISGFFALMLSQVFINTGMNMGLLPITGITLPLVSYGGSSLLSFAITFGIFLSLLRGTWESEHIAIT